MVLIKNFFPRLQGPITTMVLLSFVRTHSSDLLDGGGDEGTNVKLLVTGCEVDGRGTSLEVFNDTKPPE
jgi:hypothetical protein